MDGLHSVHRLGSHDLAADETVATLHTSYPLYFCLQDLTTNEALPVVS